LKTLKETAFSPYIRLVLTATCNTLVNIGGTYGTAESYTETALVVTDSEYGFLFAM
jgi:hypothetical protein